MFSGFELYSRWVPLHRAVSDLGCESVNVKTEIHDDN